MRPAILEDGALAGVRVLDFTWIVAGPQATRILGALGAEIIRVEWPERVDSMRLGMARQPDVEPSMNSDGFFNNLNANKYGVTLDATDPRGREILQRLIAASDVVIENFSAGTFERWGFDYEWFTSIRPDIIYLSCSGFGHSGRYRDYDTWGPSAQALAGLTFASGLPGHPPAGWGFSYMDQTAGYLGALAVLMALHYRNQTGQGQYIDMSQAESGMALTGAVFPDFSVNGRRSRRAGFPPGNRAAWPGVPYSNAYRGAVAAPHNSYPCAGGGMNDWCVIAVSTDEQWQALVDVMGAPDWARDARFATLAGRLRYQDELDAHIADWTSTLDKYAVMERLQAVGVPAGAVQSSEDRVERDPQLAARGYYVEHDHPVLGRRRFEGLPIHLSATPAAVWKAAPTIGQDTADVLRSVLGMPDDEIEQLTEAGVLWPSSFSRTEVGQ